MAATAKTWLIDIAIRWIIWPNEEGRQQLQNVGGFWQSSQKLQASSTLNAGIF